MNSTTESPSSSWLSENFNTAYVIYFLIICSIVTSLFFLCLWFLRRLFRDIQQNTFRVPHKQIPFAQKINEKTHFHAMTVNSHDENPTVTNSAGINPNESIDIRKIQEELYEKEEKPQKCEMISAIDINISELWMKWMFSACLILL